jgi:glycosyltransferase involved in cell wall biosynthesis
VLEGRNGLLVPMRDPEALSRAINGLLDDPDRLARMGAESRRLYESRFTREDFRRGLFDALRLAAGRPRREARARDLEAASCA